MPQAAAERVLCRAVGGLSSNITRICPAAAATSAAAAVTASRFNLTLGERLIEHLKNWLDPDTLLQAGPFQWKSGG
jgi:hypothetical protein